MKQIKKRLRKKNRAQRNYETTSYGLIIYVQLESLHRQGRWAGRRRRYRKVYGKIMIEIFPTFMKL